MRALQHVKEIGDYDYYSAVTLTNLYVEKVFGGNVSTINLTNDSLTDDVQFSYDGATLAGTVGPGESVRLTVDQKTSIYVKGTAGGDVVRIWSYAGMSTSGVDIIGPLNAGGSVKTSLEEYETGIIAAPLPVRDAMLEIARGNLTGHSVVNKFGQNALCGATAEEIWDGNRVYIFPTTASITHIRSAVDSAATRGVTLEVQGLNNAYELVVQTKATDAADSTVEISLDTPLRRVFRVKVLDDTTMDQAMWVGPDPASAANASAIVQAGNNQTLMAIYTVPAGKTAFMTQYYATANPNVAAGTLFEVRLWAKDNTNGYAKQLKHTKGLDKDGTSGFVHTFLPYYKFDEKTDIYITGSAGTNTVSISAGFDLILVDN